MRVNYAFRFDDGAEVNLPLVFDEQMRLNLVLDRAWPDWTQLEYHKCAKCPLNGFRCPASQALAVMAAPLAAHTSWSDVLCEVKTPNRTYTARVPLYVALGSCLGLVLATSGCPLLDHFRPMAALHIPFASSTETFLRNAALALYAQLVRKQSGLPAELSLDQLNKVYGVVADVNKQLTQRLAAAKGGSSAADAVFLLNLFAQNGESAKSQKVEAELRGLFDAWMA